MDLLHHLTWRQFGVTALLLLAGWYVLVWLLFYRQGPGDEDEVLPHRLTLRDGDPEELEVMGAAEEPAGSSVVPMEAFSFAGRQDEELLGLVPDVLEEIKQVLGTVAAQGGDKADFIRLFRAVAARYERLKLSRHIAAVHDWITDHVPFELTEEELWSLWD